MSYLVRRWRLSRAIGRGDIQAVIGYAYDPSPKIRYVVANRLWAQSGYLDEQQAAAAASALSQLSVDPDPEVRANALGGLIGLSEEGAASHLERALNDPDPRVRRLLVLLVGSLEEDWALAPLRARLEREDDPDIGAAIGDAIEQIEAAPPDEPNQEDDYADDESL